MCRTLLPIVLLSATKAFGGGSMGGTPPSIATEQFEMSSQEFQSLAVDALLNPERPIIIDGRQTQPKMIDIQARMMRLESDNQTIIEIRTTEDARPQNQ